MRGPLGRGGGGGATSDDRTRGMSDLGKSFQPDGPPTPPDTPHRNFIRGGVFDPSTGHTSVIREPRKPGGSLWLPPPASAANADSVAAAAAAAAAAAEPGASPSTAKKSTKGSHKKEIDSFLEEIKKKQELIDKKKQLYKQLSETRTEDERMVLRAQLTAIENATRLPGAPPIDLEKESSTNLYLGNLSPEITEEFLCQQFGKYGNITSVKIMYPRTEEEKKRNRNCGFVSFESRPQAEAAKHNLDGVSFYGMVIRIGWGKSVGRPVVAPSPSQLLAAGGEAMKGSTPMSGGQMGSFFTPGSGSGGMPGYGSPSPGSQNSPPRFRDRRDDVGIVEVVVPKDKRKRVLIDLLAKYVAEEGHPFEQQIMEKSPRGAEDGKFDFLYDHDSPDNIYYRWRVFAFSQGDTLRSWRTEPFHIFLGGRKWKPPSEKFFQERSRHKVEKKDDSHSAAKGGERLGSEDRDTLEEHLRDITRQRESVKSAMIFCMSHANCSAEIALCLYEALTLAETNVDSKLARLYLLSDILFNSSAPTPSAWSYRASLEKYLPRIFLHWTQMFCGNSTERESEQKDAANGEVQEETRRKERRQKYQIRRLLKRLLRIWTGWAVYSPAFLQGLEASLFSADFPAQLEEAPEEAGLPAEAAELVDDSVDGKPIAAAEACLLVKYPLQLREQIHQWCCLERSELEKLCLQRGVAARGGGGSAGCAIDRLACSEYYLQLKTEAEDAPLQLSSMGQVAALRAAAGDADALSAFWASSLAPQDSKASPEGGGGEARRDAHADEGPNGEREEKKETPGTLGRRDIDRGESEKEEVKSDSSDDIFDLPEEEEKSFEDEKEKETEKESEKETRAAMDRMKMRQVELQVTQLQVELEKKESSTGNGEARGGRLRNLLPRVHFALRFNSVLRIEGWGTNEAFGSVHGVSTCDKKANVE
ncbi:UNVERIFIED_CONTAM: RNA recognition motif-containing protein [Hammondia hammondi]|eukprot:XP_008887835.1 RNA recognition motif-containing protein [Hammondia hammondi]